MEILKRLFQVLLWIGFVGFALGLFVWIVCITEGRDIYIDEPDGMFITITILSYVTIVVTRWILFKEWIFLPWKKASTKED